MYPKPSVRTYYKDADHCVFTVWAPEQERMVLQVVSPVEKEYEMEKDAAGYFSMTVPVSARPLRYFFKPGGGKGYPDPASQFQPEGVHGPSEVIDHRSYNWKDKDWKGIPFESLILYELHVGTFTPEGTFEAIIPRLDALAETGINAIELLPVAQFPGSRNWGYDGVYPYAVQNSYGGPDGLKKLVDACHQRGIAVFLDVVYNHLGPEGNYLSRFGPYFTGRYNTPWGDAINFDGAWSDGVRDYFTDNALYWFEYYHLDGLRLDAIHMVYDSGAVHFWELMWGKVKKLGEQLGRPLYLIAESDLNSPRVVKSPELGGYGFTAQWLDDFHHALYVLLNKKDKDRYYDFGSMQQLAKAYKDGFVHSGEFVRFRKRKHGASSAGVAGERFVVFNLNHDQAGNRVGGERLSMLVDPEKVKVAAAAIMLSPYIPMLFMGEEYGDDTPFYYFVSHSDPALVEAVREGRKNEFKDFGFDGAPPDPQAENTFRNSVIQWEKREQGVHRIILGWHRELIHLRKTCPALKNFDKKNIRAEVCQDKILLLQRQDDRREDVLLCLLNLSDDACSWQFPAEFRKGEKILDSRDHIWLHEQQQKGQVLPAQITSGNFLLLQPYSVAVFRVR